MEKDDIIKRIDKEIKGLNRQVKRAEERVNSEKEYNKELVNKGIELTVHARWKEGYHEGTVTGYDKAIGILEGFKEDLIGKGDNNVSNKRG